MSSSSGHHPHSQSPFASSYPPSTESFQPSLPPFVQTFNRDQQQQQPKQTSFQPRIYSYDYGDINSPLSLASPGTTSSVSSPPPSTPPPAFPFVASSSYRYQPLQQQNPSQGYPELMSNVSQAGYGGGGAGSQGAYGHHQQQQQQQPPQHYTPQPGPSSYSVQAAGYGQYPAQDPAADQYAQFRAQDDLWAPPQFSPHELFVHGPSVPFGFKSPLPLPLPAPFSPNQSRQILQPHHAAPMSPAPPVYPIYEGPPIIAEVDMPSDEDWEVWKTTDAREGIVDMLDAEGDIPPRPIPICKRCHDYKVECSWPGQDGQGSCSNCFFAYSSCEVIPQSDSTPTQAPTKLDNLPAGLSPLPPTSSSSSSPRPSVSSHSSSQHLLPRQQVVQHVAAQSFGQAASRLEPSGPSILRRSPAGSDPAASNQSTPPAPGGSGLSSRSDEQAAVDAEVEQLNAEMERLRSRVGELQMNAQRGLDRVQEELRNGHKTPSTMDSSGRMSSGGEYSREYSPATSGSGQDGSTRYLGSSDSGSGVPGRGSFGSSISG